MRRGKGKKGTRRRGRNQESGKEIMEMKGNCAGRMRPVCADVSIVRQADRQAKDMCKYLPRYPTRDNTTGRRCRKWRTAGGEKGS